MPMAATKASTPTMTPPPSSAAVPAPMTPQPRLTAHGRTAVAVGVEPCQPGARVVAVDVTGQQGAHDVVDEGEVLVVDLAVAHAALLHQTGVVVGGLVVERELGEGHVDAHAVQSAGAGHRQHRGGHVSCSRAVGEQQLADAESDVEGLEGVAVNHGDYRVSSRRRAHFKSAR